MYEKFKRLEISSDQSAQESSDLNGQPSAQSSFSFMRKWNEKRHNELR